MFLHAPSSLVQAIFDGMADSGEPAKIRREKAEKRRIFGGFDHERVGQIDHGGYLKAEGFPRPPESRATSRWEPDENHDSRRGRVVANPLFRSIGQIPSLGR